MASIPSIHEKYMREAYRQALKAYRLGEVFLRHVARPSERFQPFSETCHNSLLF